MVFGDQTVDVWGELLELSWQDDQQSHNIFDIFNLFCAFRGSFKCICIHHRKDWFGVARHHKRSEFPLDEVYSQILP